MPQTLHNLDNPWGIGAADFPEEGTPREQLTFLVRWAVLAPSSHNSQPWRFSIRDEEIWIFADKSKWLKVADADERELHISLGCALENLQIAAQYFGYAPTVTYFPDGTDPHCIAAIHLLSPLSRVRHGQESPHRRLEWSCRRPWHFPRDRWVPGRCQCRSGRYTESAPSASPA